MFQRKERLYENVLPKQRVPLKGAEETGNSGASGDFASGGQGQEEGDLFFTASIIFF